MSRIIRPPVSPTTLSGSSRMPGQNSAGVTTISRDGRFAVSSSKAAPMQEPYGNRTPADMGAHLAQSLGLEPVFGMKKSPRVYTLQASVDEGQSQTQDGTPPVRP